MRTGVDDPWRTEGDDDRVPEPLEVWLEAGFTEQEAAVWRNWRFRLDAARRWRNSGVLDGLRAAQWTTAGVTPDDVNRWRAVRIDAAEAVSWHEFGFDLDQAHRHKAAGRRPEQAFLEDRQPGPEVGFRGGRNNLAADVGRGQELRKFLQAGVRGPVLQGYMFQQWTDEDAVAWAQQGLEATEARVWTALGLTPTEAAQQVRHGRSAVDTMTEWWRAGIPLDEVADWIGAGLQPSAAADQRARGVTAEQAATIRALRDDSDE